MIWNFEIVVIHIFWLRILCTHRFEVWTDGRLILCKYPTISNYIIVLYKTSSRSGCFWYSRLPFLSPTDDPVIRWEYYTHVNYTILLLLLLYTASIYDEYTSQLRWWGVSRGYVYYHLYYTYAPKVFSKLCALILYAHSSGVKYSFNNPTRRRGALKHPIC